MREVINQYAALQRLGVHACWGPGTKTLYTVDHRSRSHLIDGRVEFGVHRQLFALVVNLTRDA